MRQQQQKSGNCRTTVAVEADAVQALYAKRQRVYPGAKCKESFANWRAMVFATRLAYYFLPLINWGANRQAFLIDLPNRKFNLFFWTFLPQDPFYPHRRS